LKFFNGDINILWREGGGLMRNLVLILIAFIAVVTFIRAFDNSGDEIKNERPEVITEFNIDH
jgi:hypothetical protein